MATNPADDKERPIPSGDTVLVDIEDQIAWVTMNRPEKRNAISPTLAAEMLNVIEDLAINDRRGVRVLTGSLLCGTDLKEYFRGTDHMSPEERGPSSASMHNRSISI